MEMGALDMRESNRVNHRQDSSKNVNVAAGQLISVTSYVFNHFLNIYVCLFLDYKDATIV